MKFIHSMLAYFKRRQAPVVISGEQLAKLMADLEPAVEGLRVAIAENEVQAEHHKVQAARHSEATEQLNILINLGVVKMNTQAELFNTRN